MTGLTDLIERVRSGSGEDRELDIDLTISLGVSGWGAPRFTTSLDAVVRLVEEKLPGWAWQVHKAGIGQLWRPGHAGHLDADFQYPDADDELALPPIRALLAALLLALQAQEAEGT